MYGVGNDVRGPGEVEGNLSEDRDPSSLSGVELFSPLSREELRDLERRVPGINLGRRQIFYPPWHRADSFFLLLEGRIRIYRVKGSREITLSVKRPGEFFGEAGLAGLAQGAYAEALEPSRVAIMRRQALQKLVAQNPSVGQTMIEFLVGRLSTYEDKLEEVSLKEASSRLASLLVRMVEGEGVDENGGYMIPTHYTHQVLATMVGCERPALTRAIASLKQAEVIWVSQRRIHVTDLEALRGYAEA